MPQPPQPPPRDPPRYHDEPDIPPPSYDDATNPLLGGVPPSYSYGTWQDRDDSSAASSEADASDDDARLHEYVGNFVVVAFFIAVIYFFWSMLSSPVDPIPGYGPDGQPYPG